MQERGMHINEKLRAVLKGLTVLYSSQSNTTILIKSDNMTTVSYINKQGLELNLALGNEQEHISSFMSYS